MKTLAPRRGLSRIAKAWLSLAVAIALSAIAPRAFAEPIRILVSAGSKVGLAAERPLKFADNDAKRVREVMVNLGGVKASQAFLLAEPTRAQLFQAIDRARGEAASHPAAEVTLVFYFSGHGDREALHLGADRVLLSELSAKLAEVPAGLRIAVTDACRATREKGFSVDEPFAISATMIPQASGQAWLHASSDGEAAQESDELEGAIFTHAWLNGLRGAADANGDARVTLDESFAFAHSQTMIRSAKSSGVLQKPEAVVSLRESAPVVLTQNGARLASLSLPQVKDTHFLVYSAGAKSVLSELWGSGDRRILLRVPAGRYVVHQRVGSAGGIAQVALAEGEDRKLESRDFTAGSLELLARKGGDAGAVDATLTAPRHHELSVGYDAGGNVRTGLVHGPRAAYAYAWRPFAITVGGGAEFASRTLADRGEELASGYGRVTFEVRVPIGPVTLRGGAGGRAGALAQTIDVNPKPGRPASEESKMAFVAGPEAFAAVRIPLISTWFFDAGATGSVLFLREEDALRGVAGVTGGAILGAGL